MSPKVLEIYQNYKTLTITERDELFKLYYDDPKIREDMLDIALMIEAESEGMEYVTLDEFKAGKRTFHEE